MRRCLRSAAIGAAAFAAFATGQAASLQVCDKPAALSAGDQDKLLRFGAIIKRELDQSGESVALISRSGLDLGHFDVRYSHAGWSLRQSPNAPWSVRQLYYACDEHQPRIFDQGMSGFVLGTNNPALGFVSVVLLPPAGAAAVARAALDKQEALALLASTYSANAYPFSTRYQNCNQWVIELLADALRVSARESALDPSADGAAEQVAAVDEAAAADLIARRRSAAQRWLQAQAYAPYTFDVAWRPLMWASAFIPWLHNDDHPEGDLHAARYRVSMPASIEAFVRATLPGATRIEFCHTAHEVVMRRGWEPLAEGCVASAQDTVVSLD